MNGQHYIVCAFEVREGRDLIHVQLQRYEDWDKAKRGVG